MPVGCRKALVQHSVHIRATTATLLQASPCPKLPTTLHLIANGLAEMGLKIARPTFPSVIKADALAGRNTRNYIPSVPGQL